MTTTYQTQHGQITVGKPYFSHSMLCQVFTLTLVKSENESHGYGVTREFPIDSEKSPALFNQFADVASTLL